jgi:hypothetical protein
MLLIHDDEQAWQSFSEEDRKAGMDAYYAFTDELKQAGAYVAADALQPSGTATIVRVRDGETLTVDGPYAETKETLGGYYLVEVDSLEDAIRWAAKIPSAHSGSIEVRPVMVIDREEVSA